MESFPAMRYKIEPNDTQMPSAVAIDSSVCDLASPKSFRYGWLPEHNIRIIVSNLGIDPFIYLVNLAIAHADLVQYLLVRYQLFEFTLTHPDIWHFEGFNLS